MLDWRHQCNQQRIENHIVRKLSLLSPDSKAFAINVHYLTLTKDQSIKLTFSRFPHQSEMKLAALFFFKLISAAFSWPAECVFPCVYTGKWYSGCTCDDSPGQPWCCTEVGVDYEYVYDYTYTEQTWTFCDPPFDTCGPNCPSTIPTTPFSTYDWPGSSTTMGSNVRYNLI